MKNAFTMVELIFIIVIIGILSAIALPKLAAQRHDAEASKVSLFLSDCINMTMGSYMKTRHFDLNSFTCKRVTVDQPCYSLSADDDAGILTVTHGINTPICLKAQEMSEKNGLSSGSGREHHF